MASSATMNEASELISIQFPASLPLECDVIFSDVPDAPGVYLIITGRDDDRCWAFAGCSPTSLREVLQWQLVATPNAQLRNEIARGGARFVACVTSDAASAQVAQAFLVERLQPFCNPAALVPQRYLYQLTFEGADPYRPDWIYDMERR